MIIRINADIDLSRGDVLAATDAPPSPAREISATVCWLAERKLTVGARVLVQHGTAISKALVAGIDGTLDLDDLGLRTRPVWTEATELTLNDIGRVRLRLASPLPIDSYREHRTTGAFIIVDEADGWTLGAGMAGPSSVATVTSSEPSEAHSSSDPERGRP